MGIIRVGGCPALLRKPAAHNSSPRTAQLGTQASAILGAQDLKVIAPANTRVDIAIERYTFLARYH
jgi:hypothetical protein